MDPTTNIGRFMRPPPVVPLALSALGRVGPRERGKGPALPMTYLAWFPLATPTEAEFRPDMKGVRPI